MHWAMAIYMHNYHGTGKVSVILMWAYQFGHNYYYIAYRGKTSLMCVSAV